MEPTPESCHPDMGRVFTGNPVALRLSDDDARERVRRFMSGFVRFVR